MLKSVSDQPEESISIQHTIGADIIMQLDDVGKSMSSPLRRLKATSRSVKLDYRPTRG